MPVLIPEGFQLRSGGKTGWADCSAWAQSRAIGWATLGHTIPSGRTLRLLSNEPVPQASSPGLNLIQVADVASEHYHVSMDVHVGGRALDWAEYEARRLSGHGGLIQVNYAPIADSGYDAGRGFRSGHCIYEDNSETLDSLSDGRAPGVFDGAHHMPLVYDREVMKRAAGALTVGYTSHGVPIHVGYGKVWCSFTRDTTPSYAVTITPRPGAKVRHYRVFKIANGVITGFIPHSTAGTRANCGEPRAFKWPKLDNRYRWLVQIHSPGHPHDGEWVALHWSHDR